MEEVWSIREAVGVIGGLRRGKTGRIVDELIHFAFRYGTLSSLSGAWCFGITLMARLIGSKIPSARNALFESIYRNGSTF